MKFKLPKLEYNYNSLEPYIDALTMEIHYTKHHNTYLNNLNKILCEKKISNNSIEYILQEYNDIELIRNNGGGFYNHNLFWNIIGPEFDIKPSKNLENKILECFSSFKEFKNKFTNLALSHFGSGWIWLCIKNNNLIILSTINQDNPIMSNNDIYPILCLDVWEHAYYLKYQNKRIEYIDAYWNIVNWREVSNIYNNYINLSKI